MPPPALHPLPSRIPTLAATVAPDRELPPVAYFRTMASQFGFAASTMSLRLLPLKAEAKLLFFAGEALDALCLADIPLVTSSCALRKRTDAAIPSAVS